MNEYEKVHLERFVDACREAAYGFSHNPDARLAVEAMRNILRDASAGVWMGQQERWGAYKDAIAQIEAILAKE